MGTITEVVFINHESGFRLELLFLKNNNGAKYPCLHQAPSTAASVLSFGRGCFPEGCRLQATQSC